MQTESTFIDGLILIRPQIFIDERGYFFESFNQKAFFEASGIDAPFVQDNESLSHKGVLRGLHFQNPPYAQGKLVRVVKGSVLDVAVDIRTKSPTYGRHFSAVLSSENKLQLFIPPGFAHGFAVLENNTVFSYKCTAYYHKASEGTILWNDPSLQIDWMVKNPVISEKDRLQSVSWDRFNSAF